MADIEDRATAWAERHIVENDMPDYYTAWKESLIAAYLAGSRQTQKDYVEHFHMGQGHETERGGM